MPESFTSANPRIGESHRVEIADAEVLDGFFFLVLFADVDRPHRRYRECLSRSEAEGLSIGDRGSLTLNHSRVNRGGRWRFAPESSDVSTA